MHVLYISLQQYKYIMASVSLQSKKKKHGDDNKKVIYVS